MIGFSNRIPLARRMITHRKGRLVLSLLGIAFSVIIMFMEIGFFNGINDSQANLPPLLKADLVLMHERRYSMLETNTIPRLRLQQALADGDVAEAIPFYEGMDTLLNPENRRLRAIAILAFPPAADPLSVPGIGPYREALKIKGNVLYDHLSREIYGAIGPGVELLLGGAPHQVVGTVGIGPNIKLDGYILMGDATWIADGGDPEAINMGLLRLKPGADTAAVKARLIRDMPKELLIMTPEEVRKREVVFTTQATPTGSVFGVGVIIGFIIGVIICYQILFNEIMDHLPQYATMKAIGFGKPFLIRLVMQQALFLSLLGFIPGLLGGLALYTVIQHFTRILMFMTAGRVALIFLLTVFMCVFAGMLAVKKVLRADPAELF
jgi:putative ABC transport system permease protein